MLVSAAAGVELADLGGRHHVGGGSHGSLLDGDSLVPMLVVGDAAPPASILGVAPLVLEHFGVPAPAYAVPPESARRARMVDDQLRGRDIVDERVLDAMERVPRELFVPDELRDRAYEDAALPIGAGQTISQPYMVARIAEELGLDGDERVLDVGTGSGYQAALLAELADEVHTIERIPELAEQAKANLAAAGFANVAVYVGDGSRGLPSRRRSTRSPSPPRRRPSLRRSTSSCGREGVSSCPSAAAAARGSR